MAKPVSPRHWCFDQIVRDMRHAKGYSQEAFAAAAGIDRGYMGRIERGENNIALTNVWRTADTLEVDAAEIFRATEIAVRAGKTAGS